MSGHTALGSRLGKGARRVGLCAAALAALGLTGFGAQAAITTYGFSDPSGVFAVGCSGPGDGGLPDSGVFDNRNFFGPGSDCTADPLTSSASSTYMLGNASASSSGTANLQVLQGQATMSAGAQMSSDPDYTPFPAGFIDVGWVDTIEVGGGPVGSIAFANVLVNVSGVLNASGPNVTALLQLVVTSDVGNLLGVPNTPFYQIQPDPLMPETLNISDSLLLSLPFIVGTPSQFTVRAQGRAMTSSQTSGGNNMSDVIFTSTVTWGGIESVTVGGMPLSSFTATGTVSGINWALPFQEPTVALPAPGTLPLFAIGLALLIIVRWRTGGTAG